MARQLSFPATARVPLHAARANFADGAPLPANLLPAVIARSWERSRASGLGPTHAPFYDGGGTAVRSVRESRTDRSLYRCVNEEIEQLWNAFGGVEWTIFCVNTAGTVIHARRSPYCDDPRLTPIVTGIGISETQIGTTAPGCVIHDGVATIVAGAQHYLEDFAEIFCLAVPLFGIDGEIVGALDITGTGRRNVVQLREQFRYAALAAEQRLFSSLRDCHLLHLQHDPRWFGTPLSGLVAVEEGGQVRAATRLARRILGIGQGVPLPSSLLVRQLFPEASSPQERRLLQPQRSAQRIIRADGSHVWVQYGRAPLDSSALRRGRSQAVAMETPPVAASSDDAVRGAAGLREHALYAIQRALSEHNGNVAAAARKLGISRTTVYAKLRLLRQAGIAEPEWIEREHGLAQR